MTFLMTIGASHLAKTPSRLLRPRTGRVRGSKNTSPPGQTQANLPATKKKEHSPKPDEIYETIEICSVWRTLELFARFPRSGWQQWGNEDVEENSHYGVARRKGHDSPQLRLFETSRGYQGKRADDERPRRRAVAGGQR